MAIVFESAVALCCPGLSAGCTQACVVFCRVNAARDMYLSECNYVTLQDYLVQHVCRDGSRQHSPALATGPLTTLLQQLLCALTAPLDASSDPAKPAGKRGTYQRNWLLLSRLVDRIRKANFPDKLVVISIWFRSSLLAARSAIPTEDLTMLLISGMHILRRDLDSVVASGLGQLTEQLCQHANRLPPIAAADSSTREACTRALNDVFNLFHMGKKHSVRFLPRDVAHAQGAATTGEREALLALAMKQVRGEASVARAAAASRRASGIADAADEASSRWRYTCHLHCAVVAAGSTV